MIFDRTAPTRKPAFGSVQINWAHPLARGLLAVWLFNEGGGGPNDLLGRGSGTAINGPSWATDATGVGLTLLSASTQYVSCGSAVPAIVGDGAIAVRGSTQTLGDNYHMAIGRAAGTGTDWEVQLDLGNNKMALAFNGGASIECLAAVSTNVVFDFLATVSTAGAEAYFNGVLDNSAGTPTAWRTANGVIEIGRRAGSGFYWNGHLSHMYLWSRRLLAPEAMWLHAEPYAFLMPTAPRPWMLAQPVVAAGDTLFAQAIF